MSVPAICTIVSKNYLAHARALVESYFRHHPGGRAFVLLADRIDGYFDPKAEKFMLIEAADLGIPAFDQMAFRYNITEFNTAVKPFFLEYLFERYELPELIYFDPDIYIYAPLTELARKLKDHPIVLIPHITDFLDDGRQPDDVYILRAGVHNLGFIGLRDGTDSRRLLNWWKARLLRDCVIDFPRGVFVDQRWLDLVPGVFGNACVFRDAGHNVAYWNLSHRHLTCEEGLWKCNGVPLVFFHFSGLPMNELSAVSKHQDRISLSERPELRPLFQAYSDRLFSNGFAEVRTWPYAYGRFDNGEPIADAVRCLWRDTDGETRWPNPFETQSAGSFLAWLRDGTGNDSHRQLILNRMAIETWAQNWHLQGKYPDPFGEHSADFMAWFLAQPDTQRALKLLPPLPVSTKSVEKPAVSGTTGTASAALVAELPPSMARRLYYGLRAPLRKLGLTEPLKKILGSRTSASLWYMAHHRNSSHLSANVSQNKIADSRRAPLKFGGVNLIGYARAETGVGEALRSVARSLMAVGFQVALTDLTNADWARSQDTSLSHLPVGNPYATNIMVVNADMVPETIERLGQDFLENRHNIGFWHWETSNFPPEWQDRFAAFNEIWVDSGFLQKTLGIVSPVPIVNVHLAVDIEATAARNRAALNLPADVVLFLFGFDAASYIQRKNPFAVIEAYRRAFGPHYEGVGLVVKATNLHLAGAEAERLNREMDEVGGRLMTDYMDRPTLNALFASADAYVSLHRSEGFGLTMAEAMALGKPVIATAYSGNMEFMHAGNSYLTGYTIVPIDKDYGPYKRGDVWAEPDIDHAAMHMRSIAFNRNSAEAVGARAAHDIRMEFSPMAVGQRMATRLKQLEIWRRGSA